MRQREMAHIPTPSVIEFAEKMLGLDLTAWQKAVLTGTVVPHGHWPDCDRCKQSCQAVYAGKPTCRRCTSARRLNA